MVSGSIIILLDGRKYRFVYKFQRNYWTVTTMLVPINNKWLLRGSKKAKDYAVSTYSVLISPSRWSSIQSISLWGSQHLSRKSHSVVLGTCVQDAAAAALLGDLSKEWEGSTWYKVMQLRCALKVSCKINMWISPFKQAYYQVWDYWKSLEWPESPGRRPGCKAELPCGRMHLPCLVSAPWDC